MKMKNKLLILEIIAILLIIVLSIFTIVKYDSQIQDVDYCYNVTKAIKPKCDIIKLKNGVKIKRNCVYPNLTYDIIKVNGLDIKTNVRMPTTQKEICIKQRDILNITERAR